MRATGISCYEDMRGIDRHTQRRGDPARESWSSVHCSTSAATSIAPAGRSRSGRIASVPVPYMEVSVKSAGKASAGLREVGGERTLLNNNESIDTK